MEVVHQAIQILLVLLIVAGLAIAVRTFTFLGTAEKMLESTRADVDKTVGEVNRVLARVETVTASADKMLNEELAPTLRIARATITDVEVITRALADTTTSVRRITGRAEAAVSSSRMLAAGSVLAQVAAKQGAKAAGGALMSLGAGLTGILFHRKQARPKAASNGKNGGGRVHANELIIDPEDERGLPAKRRR